jgi:hypothetical protein
MSSRIVADRLVDFVRAGPVAAQQVQVVRYNTEHSASSSSRATVIERGAS